MIYLWIIGLALLVTALFSAAEMSFIAANRVRLRHIAEGGNRTVWQCGACGRASTSSGECPLDAKSPMWGNPLGGGQSVGEVEPG